MLDLNELKNAFFDYLKSDDNDFISGLTGGFHYDNIIYERPEDVVYPYAVYRFGKSRIERDTGSKYYHLLLTIEIYDAEGKDSEQIAELGNELQTLLDDKESEITLDNYYLLDIHLSNIPDETRTDIDSWQHIQIYEIEVQTK